MSVRLTSSTRSVRLGAMATDFLKDFGQAVRQLRRERGMTQGELADRLKLGRTSITNLEKGEQNPPLSLLPDIASALGVDIMRLLDSVLGLGRDPGAAALTARVQDDQLRRWAGQVIGDTMTSQSPNADRPDARGRRKA